MNSTSGASEPIGVASLLATARAQLARTRRMHEAAIADLFDGGTSVLTEQQRSLLGGLFQALAATLAQHLRSRMIAAFDVPSPTGAGDVDTAYEAIAPRIAAAIRASSACRDGGLVEVALGRVFEHRLAVALAIAAGGTVEGAAEGAVEGVAPASRTSGGAFDTAVARYVYEQSRRTDRYGNPVLSLVDVAPDSLRRLGWAAAAAMRPLLVERSGVDEEQIDDVIEAVVRDLPQSVAAEGAAQPYDAVLTSIAAALDRAKGRPGALYAQALATAAPGIAFGALSARSGVPMRLVRRMVVEPGGACLAAIARSAEMPEPVFVQLCALVDRVRGGENTRPASPPREDGRAVFEALSKSDARRLVRYWSRPSGYLDAIRQAGCASSQP